MEGRSRATRWFIELVVVWVGETGFRGMANAVPLSRACVCNDMLWNAAAVFGGLMSVEGASPTSLHRGQFQPTRRKPRGTAGRICGGGIRVRVFLWDFFWRSPEGGGLPAGEKIQQGFSIEKRCHVINRTRYELTT